MQSKKLTVDIHQILNKNGPPMLQGNCKCKISGGFVFTLPMLAAMSEI